MDRRKLKSEELQDFPYHMVEKITESVGEYKKFLDFYSKFYKYNIINALMIYGQSPNATAVGTYEQWKSKSIERGVRKKAFPIKLLQGKKWETAFDIADTYGKAFTYKNSYTLTEQEQERLTTQLGVSDENGSNPFKIEHFLVKEISGTMGKLSGASEKFQEAVKGCASVLFESAIHLARCAIT